MCGGGGGVLVGLFVVYCCFYLFVYDTTVCVSSVLRAHLRSIAIWNIIQPKLYTHRI